MEREKELEVFKRFLDKKQRNEGLQIIEVKERKREGNLYMHVICPNEDVAVRVYREVENNIDADLEHIEQHEILDLNSKNTTKAIFRVY